MDQSLSGVAFVAPGLLLHAPVYDMFKNKDFGGKLHHFHSWCRESQHSIVLFPLSSPMLLTLKPLGDTFFVSCENIES